MESVRSKENSLDAVINLRSYMTVSDLWPCWLLSHLDNGFRLCGEVCCRVMVNVQEVMATSKRRWTLYLRNRIISQSIVHHYRRHLRKRLGEMKRTITISCFSKAWKTEPLTSRVPAQLNWTVYLYLTTNCAFSITSTPIMVPALRFLAIWTIHHIQDVKETQAY